MGYWYFPRQIPTKQGKEISKIRIRPKVTTEYAYVIGRGWQNQVCVKRTVIEQGDERENGRRLCAPEKGCGFIIWLGTLRNVSGLVVNVNANDDNCFCSFYIMFRFRQSKERKIISSNKIKSQWLNAFMYLG